MIDIGANLTNSRFKNDLTEVLIRAQEKGLSKIVITGTNLAESQAALLLCQQHPTLLACTAGIHPHDASSAPEDFIGLLTELAKADAVKAIGECGLDFNRNFSTPADQIRVFEKQVALASTLSLPLFLHQRDAFEPWLDILMPYLGRVPAMISHCFTGNKEQLETCVELGMYIGITGWICDERRGEELREAVRYLPLEQLMIETDAPYLTPRNIRPKPKSSRNEPGYLPYIVQTLAEVMGHSSSDIIEYSQRNAEQVFNL